MAESDVRQPTKSAASAVHAEAIVLDTLLAGPTRYLWVGAAGNVNVTFVSGVSATLIGVLAGTMLPISVTKVNTTGTTVASPTTNIVALR